MALICAECNRPIVDKDVEWVNIDGEQKPFHTGQRFDPEVCAYIARHRKILNHDYDFSTQTDFLA